MDCETCGHRSDFGNTGRVKSLLRVPGGTVERSGWSSASNPEGERESSPDRIGGKVPLNYRAATSKWERKTSECGKIRSGSSLYPSVISALTPAESRVPPTPFARLVSADPRGSSCKYPRPTRRESPPIFYRLWVSRKLGRLSSRISNHRRFSGCARSSWDGWDL